MTGTGATPTSVTGTVAELEKQSMLVSLTLRHKRKGTQKSTYLVKEDEARPPQEQEEEAEEEAEQEVTT